MCLYMKVKNAMPEKTPEFLLFVIGTVMGLIGLIVRGIENIMKHFSADPLGTVERLRQK